MVRRRPRVVIEGGRARGRNLSRTTHEHRAELRPNLRFPRRVDKCRDAHRPPGMPLRPPRRPAGPSGSGLSGGNDRPSFRAVGALGGSGALCAQKTGRAAIPGGEADSNTPPVQSNSVARRLWTMDLPCAWCGRGAIIVWHGSAHCRWHWELNRRYGRLEVPV